MTESPILQYSYSKIDHFGVMLVDDRLEEHRVIERIITSGAAPPDFSRFSMTCTRKTGLAPHEGPPVDQGIVPIDAETAEEALLKVPALWAEWESESKSRCAQAKILGSMPADFDPMKLPNGNRFKERPRR